MYVDRIRELARVTVWTLGAGASQLATAQPSGGPEHGGGGGMMGGTGQYGNAEILGLMIGIAVLVLLVVLVVRGSGKTS